MEKFTRIAESILNLEAYKDYEIKRIDIQYNNIKNEMIAYVTYFCDALDQEFQICIMANGTFNQI